MGALWPLGSASVRELREALPASKQCAHTTVHTILSRLEDKGVVRRAGKVGGAIVFEPVVARDDVHRGLVDELISLIGGTSALMAHLVDSGKLSLEDVRRLESALAEIEASEGGSGAGPEAETASSGRRATGKEGRR